MSRMVDDSVHCPPASADLRIVKYDGYWPMRQTLNVIRLALRRSSCAASLLASAQK